MKPLSQKDMIQVVIDADSIDDNNPMKIRNAIRTERILDALAWAKSWTDVNVLAICPHCSKERLIFSNPEDEFDHSCKNCLVDRAFGAVVKK